ncbi:MAG TPA: hypothetical protein VJ904_08885, partial [Tichowtungia sp.]|nr:hypothetical protein [Tichowtungia sp.]
MGFKTGRKEKTVAAIAVFAVCGTWVAQAAVPAHELIKDATGLDVGTLNIGGAIRANYVKGEYPDQNGPSRGGDGGNMELDTFRIDVDWEKDSWIGSAQYRWYNGYNFFHHAWLGYKLDESSTIKAGLNRVPFGVGAYGPANSWFFDQHYYVGLADDMDMGVKYTRTMNNMTMDLAYYVAAEPSGNGTENANWAENSARYGYDIVDTGQNNSRYQERNQFNARFIVSTMQESDVPTDVGVSLQAGQLQGSGGADDTLGYAASLHSSSTMGPWNLKLQLTSYDYRPDYNDPAQSDDLIHMGAYNFNEEVASQGVIPAAALSYTVTPEKYDWVDSITFYNDFSIIMKDGKDNAGNKLNDSAMNVTGMAIAAG